MTDLRHAEQATLGAMLLSPAALDDVTEILTGTDFYEPRHELIFNAALSIAATGKRADTLTVATQLGDDLERAGGRTYLHELVEAVPTASNAAYYAQAVIAPAAILRKVVEVGTRLQQLATTEADALDVVDAARQQLDALVTDESSDIPHEQAVYQAIDALEDSPGLATPWTALTDCLAGWKPGALYIVGARPSVGKSVIAAGTVLDAARRGHHGAMFSLEMSSTELYHRMLAAVGSVDMSRIQHRKLTEDDHNRLAKAAANIATLPMSVDDRAELSVAQIRAKARAIQRKARLGVLVIDYLQLIKPPTDAPRNDRRVQVDAISRSLKNLAKDLNVPVVALTQLNRASELRSDKTPTLSDLREAGGQEQDADVVMLLHRETNPDKGDPSDLRVIVAKNRHGPRRQLSLDFRGHYSRADEPTSTWTPHRSIDRSAS